MRKRFLTLPLFLLAALFLTVSVSGAGETAIGRIEIENRAYSGVSFSCDVKLSGVQMQGCLFAVVCAESERVKSVSDYPAAETVKVTLRNVAETDCVKILWVDAKHMPLANPAVLRMSANNTAAYEKFTKDLAALKSFDGAVGEAASGSASPYALKRLLVSCDTLPDLSRYHGKVTIVSGPDNLYVLQFNNPAVAEECEQYLKSASSVRYVEPDAVMTANAEPDAKISYEARSWGVSKTGIGEYAENLRQRGVQRPVIVAVVDSGVERDHPFLKNRLIPGYDYIEYDDIPQDENGHGTHVAGTIADCTPYMDVKIMPVRALDAFASGSYLSIANGIRHAANHGANIINLSLGSTKHSQTIEDAVNDALSKNVTVVVAAGNKMGNVDHFCPAHMEDCITVAAVDSDLKRYELSNYGEAVDIAAPGVGINSSTLNGRYGEMSGTSMATPHVSAAAALLMSERGTGQTPFQISSLLRDATTDIGEPGKDVYFGAGFLNMRPFVLHSVYALLYADGELVFQKNNTPASNRELVKAYPVSVSGEAGGQYAAWYERRADIRKITFADTIRPTSSALWFYGCTNLTEIQGLENLDASELTDMSQMFARCTSLQTLDLTALDTSKVETLNGMFFFCEKLTELDLTGWNTERVTDTRDMFMACAALETVYASESFITGGVSDSSGMFGGCTSLVGGSSTKYDSTHTDKAYARIDGGSPVPGYFTDKNAPPDVLTLNYSDTNVYANDHDHIFVSGNDNLLYDTVIVNIGDTAKAGYSVSYNYANAPGLQLKAYLNDVEIPASLVDWKAEKQYGYGNVDENGYVSSSSNGGFTTGLAPSKQEQTITATLKSNPTVSTAVKITFVYDAKIRFAIEDTSVATVDESGVVYGRSEGETTLSMISDLTGRSASCKVSVGKRTNKTFDLVYKRNNQFYSLNSYGGPEYASINANDEIYFRMPYDDELVWGTKLDVGIVNAAYRRDTFTVEWKEAVPVSGSGIYFPLSSVLKNYAGNALVYYQLTFADGQILYKMARTDRDCFFLNLA